MAPRWEDEDEPEGGSPEEMPVSRGARARSMGSLAVGLGSTLLKAGGKSLLSGAGDRRSIWQEAHKEGALQVFTTLGRMRGIAAKIGQMLTTSPGGLPDEYVERLLDLTNQVPPMHYSLIKTRIFQELGKSPTDLFASFEKQPIAAASLGQVHKAKLKDGTDVAVKVQYPAIDDTLRADIDNVRLLLKPLKLATGLTNLEELIAEVEARFGEETDYVREAANTERLTALFAPEKEIVFPRVHHALSTKRVLTMDFLEGKDLRTFLEGAPPRELKVKLGLLLLRFTWLQEFVHGVLHVDPNPGNYLFRADGTLGVLDFGNVQVFHPDFPRKLRVLLRAGMEGDRAKIDDALVDAGMVAPGAAQDVWTFYRQLTDIWARPFKVRPFDFADRSYLREMIHLQRGLGGENGWTVPAEWIFIGRNFLGLAYILSRLEVKEDLAGLIEEVL